MFPHLFIYAFTTKMFVLVKTNLGAFPFLQRGVKAANHIQVWAKQTACEGCSQSGRAAQTSQFNHTSVYKYISDLTDEFKSELTLLN